MKNDQNKNEAYVPYEPKPHTKYVMFIVFLVIFGGGSLLALYALGVLR